MAVTRYGDGNRIDYTPGSAKTAGDVVVLSSGLIGVVDADIAANALGALAITGLFKCPKASGALVAGQIVYWDAGNANVTGTPGSKPRFGTVALAAASGDANCYVIKDGTTRGTVAGAGTLDGSNPTAVTTGLTICTAAIVQLKGSSAPGDNTSVLTVVVGTADFDVYAWKNTSGTDPTLVASTGTEDFYWIAWGY